MKAMRQSHIQTAFLILAVAAVCVGFQPELAHASYAAGFDNFSKAVLEFMRCELRGSTGYLIMGVCGLIALWQFFVEHKAVHMWTAIIGIVVVILIGRVLPGTGSCG